MDNLRGAILMVLAMLGFAIEDAFVKILAIDLPAWQIIASLGAAGSLIFGTLVVLSGQSLLSRSFLTWPVMARNLLEMIASDQRLSRGVAGQIERQLCTTAPPPHGVQQTP